MTVALTVTGDGTVLELAHEGPIDPMSHGYGPGASGLRWDLGHPRRAAGRVLGIDRVIAVGPQPVPATILGPKGTG